MITLEQAQQWTQKYSNVTIIYQIGEQFCVELRDKDGMLICHEWNFGECSELIECIQKYGIEKQLYAHILHTSVAGMQIICVVITQDFELELYKDYTAVMVADETEAQALALKRNAIIVTSDKATK